MDTGAYGLLPQRKNCNDTGRMSITNKISPSHKISRIILIIAAALRLWHLGSVPPSLSLDEVSIGYNAYSILKTGTDEYGYRFPLLLRAYDDWRPASYAYMVMPFVWLFGLSVWAVRLPAALLGTAVIGGTYLLVREMLGRGNVNRTDKTNKTD